MCKLRKTMEAESRKGIPSSRPQAIGSLEKEA
jgi:hypothetical protein